jgi:hypothetical protein
MESCPGRGGPGHDNAPRGEGGETGALPLPYGKIQWAALKAPRPELTGQQSVLSDLRFKSLLLQALPSGGRRGCKGAQLRDVVAGDSRRATRAEVLLFARRQARRGPRLSQRGLRGPEPRTQASSPVLEDRFAQQGCSLVMRIA